MIDEAVVADCGDEEVLAEAEAREEKLGEEGLHGSEGADAGELFDHGIGFIVVGEFGVELSCVVEDLEGKVEVMLAVEHGGEALWSEACGPGLVGKGDNVGFEEVIFGTDCGERMGWEKDGIDGSG